MKIALEIFALRLFLRHWLWSNRQQMSDIMMSNYLFVYTILHPHSEQYFVISPPFGSVLQFEQYG